MAETNSAAENAAPTGDPVWSFWLPVLLFVIMISLGFVIPVSALVIARLLGGIDTEMPLPADPDVTLLALISLGSTLLTWLIVFRILRGVFRAFPLESLLRSLGVRRPSPSWSNFVAIPAGVLALLLAQAVLYALGAKDDETLFQLMMKTPVTAVALVIFALIVAPITEEAFFRGVFFPPFARQLGVVGAVLVTTAFFSVSHFSAYQEEPRMIAGVAVIGLTLGTIRAWTGSIVPCVLAHMAFNATTFILFFADPSSNT